MEYNRFKWETNGKANNENIIENCTFWSDFDDGFYGNKLQQQVLR